MKIIGEKLFQLMPKDIIKGAFLAMIAVIGKTIYDMINSNIYPTDLPGWINLGKTFAGVFLAYLLKNWLTNSKDEILKSEQKNEVTK